MKAMKAIKAKRRTPEERAKKQIEDMVTKHGIIKQFGQTFDYFSDDMMWKKKKLLSITIDMVRHFIKEIWIDAKIFGGGLGVGALVLHMQRRPFELL